MYLCWIGFGSVSILESACLLLMAWCILVPGHLQHFWWHRWQFQFTLLVNYIIGYYDFVYSDSNYNHDFWMNQSAHFGAAWVRLTQHLNWLVTDWWHEIARVPIPIITVKCADSVTSYGDMNLIQDWLRYWVVAWCHQAITYTNANNHAHITMTSRPI